MKVQKNSVVSIDYIVTDEDNRVLDTTNDQDTLQVLIGHGAIIPGLEEALIGHEAGDKLLVRAASLMKIAFEGSEIFRAGGDEFVVISPNCTEENLALRVSQLRGLTDNTSDVSFAIGTEFCTESYDIRVAMNVADGRMYQDKAEYYRTHPEKNQRRNQK